MFTTSVTVFIALGHELLAIAYDTLLVNVKLVWESIATICRYLVRVLRTPRTFNRRTLKIAVADFQQSKSYVEAEKPRYGALRIASLRYQDEQYIAQNTSLMDARVFIWLIHNAGRLTRRVDLAYAFMRFPHLVRHRKLLIENGGLTLLEDLFRSWYNAQIIICYKWSSIQLKWFFTKRKRFFVTLKRFFVTLKRFFVTLKWFKHFNEAIRVTEAEVDGAEFSEMNIPNDSVLDGTPFLLVQRPHQHLDAVLSNDSLKLLTEGDHAVEWTRLGGNRLIEEFLRRLMNFTTAGSAPRSDLVPAVNTVIYLALCDAARPQRNGFALASTGGSVSDIRYWLTVLLNVMHRVPMDDATLPQICWGICALSWALSPQTNGVALRPLVPRLPEWGMRDLAGSMVDLLSCNQDPDVLSTVVLALEGMLWNTTPGMWVGHNELCRALQSKSRYGLFMDDIYRKLIKGEFATHRLSRILVSLTRIAAYLSFFDRAGPEDTKVSLTATVFSILKYLLIQVSPAKRRTSPEQTSTSRAKESTTMDMVTRRWTYRAVCRIVVLYLKDPRWMPFYQGPCWSKPSSVVRVKQVLRCEQALARSLTKSNSPIPTDLIYTDDLESIVATGADFVAAVEALPVIPNETRWRPLQPFTREAFCSIVKDAFTRELHFTSDVREMGGWDRDMVRMVSEAVRSRKLLETLLASPYTCVHIDLLVPVVHYVYTTLFSGPRPILVDGVQGHPGQKTLAFLRRYDTRHPAHQMALALRHVWVPFLCKFTEELNYGSHVYSEMHELLIELICISGYLAFFEHPDELPRGENEHAMIQYLLALIRSRPTRTPMQIRRYVWSALGSMAALYLYSTDELRDEEDPIRHFRPERASPEDIAIGLTRIVSSRYYALLKKKRPQPHCRECALYTDGVRQLTGNHWRVPAIFAEAALEMMLEIWDSADWESLEIQKRLLHHAIGPVVRVLSVVEGNTGTLADRLATRI
ncbi:hypothetical protein L227DRAFT_604968 [Lentinus tigrinus ALCF2SS1-6]|uniref:Uncharacterized protein n=1 Tax=Lentinus tigrinus ALCF2SS1-6 TaxID=1328759 RepID=A0A5C2RM30_9APHY|nr:hypothetical protein L227DRAFT_604968 [Lentinus tigrinus ALCF2SS1-6]